VLFSHSTLKNTHTHTHTHKHTLTIKSTQKYIFSIALISKLSNSQQKKIIKNKKKEEIQIEFAIIFSNPKKKKRKIKFLFCQ